MKRFCLAIFLCCLSCPAFAICGGTFLNPITDVRWSCMLPISLGGVSTPFVPLPEAASAIVADQAGSIAPMCACVTPEPRVGLSFGMNNVFRIIESVKDPFCFPSLGMGLSSMGPYGRGGQDAGVRDTAQTTFNYTHILSFVPTQALNIFIDTLCLQTSESFSPFSVLGMSEFEPWARSDEVALILAPESVLFANPIAQAYCMVDAVLTVVELTDPIGYWCAGGHSVFPLSRRTSETEYVDAASINAAKYLFELSRTGQLPSCLGAQALCACVPVPVWNKREFRLQLAKPVPDIFCRRIGKPSIIWNTPNKNSALTKGADNLAFLVWRRRDCCAL